jgi:hypothetical protein
MHYHVHAVIHSSPSSFLKKDTIPDTHDPLERQKYRNLQMTLFLNKIISLFGHSRLILKLPFFAFSNLSHYLHKFYKSFQFLEGFSPNTVKFSSSGNPETHRSIFWKIYKKINVGERIARTDSIKLDSNEQN